MGRAKIYHQTVDGMVRANKDFDRGAMPGYGTDADADELYPDDGQFSVVCIDRFKSTDDPEFIQKIQEFDTAEDVILPPEKNGYQYYVYAADGETYGRDNWPPEK